MYKNSLLRVFSILFFVVFLISSAIANEQYDSCPPSNSSCGFQLKYPFWDSNLPEYCGHPTFKLDCNEYLQLTINIKNQTYTILDINYDDKVFSLTKPQLLTGPCPDNKTLLTNTTLDPNLFGLTSDSQNATLFYGCLRRLKSDPDAPYGFRCTINDTFDSRSSLNSDIGYLAVSGSKLEQDLRNNCSFEVQVPIRRTEAVMIANGASNVEQILNKGFEVKWMIDDHGQCDNCSKSEGRCGFNQTSEQQTCFCKDGAHGLSCHGLHKYTLAPTGSLAPTGTSKRRIAMPIIVVCVTLGTAVIASIIYFLFKWRARGKDKHTSDRYSKSKSIPEKKAGKKAATDSYLFRDKTQIMIEDLQVSKLEDLIIATDGFSESNLLGKGGFGQVYKGKLENGQEIAVKRLSRASGQGVEEFMNEVELISKLQHRNLVQLLGCFVEGEEKMLIYEYMPNKSLDAFLFDPQKQELSQWQKRFNIIQGICRGLLYLHRDSRLKIIHRDLKPSNILLDQELNPKISDFGMARIFSGNQDQASTQRVVGTYGYMSPEYAMEGHFSEKSDVFSFGVLLLEIVSGKKNSSFWYQEDFLSLLGYTWKLWNENTIETLIDPSISSPDFQEEILRCIHVGLLCVQEIARDRPNTSVVMSMLVRDIMDLPSPKAPGYTQRQISADTGSSQITDETSSTNHVTITTLTAR